MSWIFGDWRRYFHRYFISTLRKDVAAKCCGGDAAHKRKLLDKRKEGKKRMRQFGKVDIPLGASIEALRMGDCVEQNLRA
jgi:GTP-binding protein LepA